MDFNILMPNKMEINVERRHIMEGTRSNCKYCPVALAIKEKKYVFFAVDVGLNYVKLAINSPANLTTYRLPPKARKFIENFDDGIPVTPFQFVMEKE